MSYFPPELGEKIAFYCSPKECLEVLLIFKLDFYFKEQGQRILKKHFTTHHYSKYIGDYWSLPNGLYHRDDDQPALITPNGRKEWWFNGLLHRDDDKPTIIFPNGTQKWYKHGLVHRKDGPAIIYNSQSYEYWDNGVELSYTNSNGSYKVEKTHDGSRKTTIITPFSEITYNEYMQYHSFDDEPSMKQIGGTWKWYKNGSLHRINHQPAVIMSDGSCEWWIDGTFVCSGTIFFTTTTHNSNQYLSNKWSSYSDMSTHSL